MNKVCVFPVALVLLALCSCQKSQTEEERNAEINRRVEERLAAERQTQHREELEQRESDLDSREKALAEKENATDAKTKPKASGTLVSRPNEPVTDDPGASYSMFYTKLDQDGAWRETSDYGYVWQPDVAQRSRDWRPYTNGRWVYTDVGWMWVSEEPFGWATYHYGRWTRLRHIGWVWVPGDEWAPAWVSWRKSDNYIGWAPLPPEARFDRRAGIRNWADNYYEIGPDQYCFVPTRQFGTQRTSPTVVSSEQNVAIVSQTTNVTNITYNNTTIVNQGPDYYELRTRTQQPIEHLRVERRTAASPHDEDLRPVVRGEVIEVVTPRVGKREPTERPRRVKEAVFQTAVDRGWNTVPDSQDAEKARAKIKSESTPPPDAPPREFVKPAQAYAATENSVQDSDLGRSREKVEMRADVQPLHASPSSTPLAVSLSPAPMVTPVVMPESALSSTPFASATPIPKPAPTAMPSAQKQTPPTSPISAPSQPDRTTTTTPKPQSEKQKKAESKPAAKTSPSPSASGTPTRDQKREEERKRKEQEKKEKKEKREKQRKKEAEARKKAALTATPTPIPSYRIR